MKRKYDVNDYIIHVGALFVEKKIDKIIDIEKSEKHTIFVFESGMKVDEKWFGSDNSLGWPQFRRATSTEIKSIK